MNTRMLSTALVGAVALVGAYGAADRAVSAQAAAKQIPKAQLIKRADAICTKGNRHITLQPPQFDPAHPTADQLRSAAPFLHQLAHVIGGEVTAVRALGIPDPGAAAFRRAMTESRHLVHDMRAQARAARAGDVPAFLAASRRADANTSGPQLARFGFRVCGH